MLDTPAKRIALGIALGLIALVAWQNGWLADVSPMPVTADTIVVIEESGTRTPDHAVVLFGATANKLRTANQWYLFDDDELPQAYKATVAAIKTPVPYVLFYSGDRVVRGPLPLPKTEAEFAAMIQGGM
jgi:hypothetical protein